MKREIQIKKEKLLLVEGVDALHFFISALEAYKIDDVQVLDFGGIHDLSNYFRILKNLDNYDNVKTIVIARDAEKDVNAAIKSINQTLGNNFKKTPNEPFKFLEDPIKLAYMIFPGYDNNRALLNGTLEDLCLGTVNCDLKNISDSFINDLDINFKFKSIHKTKLHNYLSISDAYVGNKLGEAAKSGAWNWEHSTLIPYKKILKEM